MATRSKTTMAEPAPAGKKEIIISTGTLDREFEVIDCVFALDSDRDGLLGGADPGKAFRGVKEQLRKQCRQLGGDAVLDCEFEYRMSEKEGALSRKMIAEIFAYGTVVRFL